MGNQTFNQIYDKISNIRTAQGETYECTLQDASHDNQGGYLSQERLKVINMDLFIKDYCSQRSMVQFRSCDALVKTKQGEFYLIEFKNERIDKAETQKEVLEKLFETLLILAYDSGHNIHDLVGGLRFRLVYSDSKNPTSGFQKNINAAAKQGFRETIEQYAAVLVKDSKQLSDGEFADMASQF
jgi:hypothetical protein